MEELVSQLLLRVQGLENALASQSPRETDQRMQSVEAIVDSSPVEIPSIPDIGVQNVEPITAFSGDTPPQDERWYNRFKPTWVSGEGTIEVFSGAWVTRDDNGDIWYVDKDGFSKEFTQPTETSKWSVDITIGSPYIVATLPVDSSNTPTGGLTMAATNVTALPSNATWTTKRLICTGTFSEGLDDLVRNQVGDIVDLGGGSTLPDGDSINKILIWDEDTEAWIPATYETWYGTSTTDTIGSRPADPTTVPDKEKGAIWRPKLDVVDNILVLKVFQECPEL